MRIMLATVALCLLLGCMPSEDQLPNKDDFIYTLWVHGEGDCKEKLTFYHDSTFELYSSKEIVSGSFSYAKPLLKLSNIKTNGLGDCRKFDYSYLQISTLSVQLSQNKLKFNSLRGDVVFTRTD